MSRREGASRSQIAPERLATVVLTDQGRRRRSCWKTSNCQPMPRLKTWPTTLMVLRMQRTRKPEIVPATLRCWEAVKDPRIVLPAVYSDPAHVPTVDHSHHCPALPGTNLHLAPLLYPTEGPHLHPSHPLRKPPRPTAHIVSIDVVRTESLAASDPQGLQRDSQSNMHNGRLLP